MLKKLENAINPTIRASLYAAGRITATTTYAQWKSHVVELDKFRARKDYAPAGVWQRPHGHQPRMPGWHYPLRNQYAPPPGPPPQRYTPQPPRPQWQAPRPNPFQTRFQPAPRPQPGPSDRVTGTGITYAGQGQAMDLDRVRTRPCLKCKQPKSASGPRIGLKGSHRLTARLLVASWDSGIVEL